jgi:cell division septum initiation protein DivIVA
MMDLLTKLGLRKKKSRREKVQDAVSDTIHNIADTVDELVKEVRKGPPKATSKTKVNLAGVGQQVSKVAGQVAEQAGEVAGQVKEQASEVAEQVREQASDVAEQVAEKAARVTGKTQKASPDPLSAVAEAASQMKSTGDLKMEALLAALGALTANWDDIARALSEELGETFARAEKEGKKPEPKPVKKERAFPAFWVWILRLGVGLWFVERLRSRDNFAYIDHGAGDRMREQSEGHPIDWYKEFLDTLFIPNASIFAVVMVFAESLAALGYLTGINRRFAALVGLTISGNELLADYKDHDRRGQNLIATLAQALLLRTGG